MYPIYSDTMLQYIYNGEYLQEYDVNPLPSAYQKT
jgi:hypothetical protein